MINFSIFKSLLEVENIENLLPAPKHVVSKIQDAYDGVGELPSHLHTRLSEHYSDVDDQSVKHYSSTSKKINYSLINKHINSNFEPDSDTQDHINKISSSITQKGLPSSLDVYSSAGRNWEPHKSINDDHGFLMHTPAFTSATTDYGVAHGWSHNENTGDTHILHFMLPKGYTKGAYIGHHSQDSAEKEFLLDKDQAWHFLGHHTTDTDPHGNEGAKVHHYTFIPFNHDAPASVKSSAVDNTGHKRALNFLKIKGNNTDEDF